MHWLAKRDQLSVEMLGLKLCSGITAHSLRTLIDLRRHEQSGKHPIFIVSVYLCLQGCMRAMMAVWTNITLTRAFNGWVLAAQQLKDKRTSQAHAVAFWSSREVAQVRQAVCLHTACISAHLGCYSEPRRHSQAACQTFTGKQTSKHPGTRCICVTSQ